MKTLLFIVAAIPLAACSTNPNKVSAAYVSPLNYAQYNCQQLAMESGNIQRRVNVVHSAMKKENTKDKWAMGVGLVLFWPALFALSGGNEAQGVELAQLKGEYEAVQSAQVGKNCMVNGQVTAIAPNELGTQPNTETAQPMAVEAQSNTHVPQSNTYAPRSNVPKPHSSRLRNGETVVIGEGG